jgi:peptidoglycan/LPS O-acetylase OafA/YrhL
LVKLQNVSPILVGALAGAVPFAAFAFLVELASPLRILLGSLAVALFFGIMSYRKSRRMPLLPTWGLLVLGIGALALYTWALLVRQQPVGTEWLAVALIFAVPVAVLVQAYRQWKRRA